MAPPPETAPKASTDTRALHQQILDRLGPSPIPEDLLIRDIGRAPGVVSSEIAALEIDGRIKRDAGGLLSRVVSG